MDKYAIAFAQHLMADLVFLDAKAARQVAIERGLNGLTLSGWFLLLSDRLAYKPLYTIRYAHKYNLDKFWFGKDRGKS
jgi:hypothetical protein